MHLVLIVHRAKGTFAHSGRAAKICPYTRHCAAKRRSARLENGMTLFDTDADEFAIYGKRMVEMGVRIIGGCCGTTQVYKETHRRRKECSAK